MARAMGILALSLGLTLAVSGQQRSDVRLRGTDTVGQAIVVDPGISLGGPTLLLPPTGGRGPKLRATEFLLPEWNIMGSQRILGVGFEEKLDLLFPLRPRMEEELRLRPVYSAVKTVQMAGVAYLAYRHIKKYGFWE